MLMKGSFRHEQYSGLSGQETRTRSHKGHKAASELNRAVDVSKRRRSWGGPRDLQNRTPSTKKRAGGVFIVKGGIGVPSPPRSASRNKRRRLDGEPEVPDEEEVLIPKLPKHRRAGRPISWKPFVRNGVHGYWLSARRQKYFLKKDALKDPQIKMLKAEVASLKARRIHGKKLKVPKSDKVAVATLLQAKRVSASNVPEVIAIVSQYLNGHVRAEHLMAPSTALDYARDSGEVFRQRSIHLIGSNKLHFFIGTDTSNRGGSIASYVVSYIWENTPVKKFFSFERMDEKDAAGIAKGIIRVVSTFTEEGGRFLGFSSDAPNVMVGVHDGVGVLLSRHFGRYIRHDRCEHHASACVLRVLETIWPAQMNVESVTQLGYLCWYILNEDWEMYQAYMIRAIDAEPAHPSVVQMLQKFGGSVSDAKKLLKKPDKPTGSRWRTLSDMIVFVWQYREVLRLAFDKKRCNEGAGGAAPGSIAAMCSQWIKWASSSKLVALLNVAREYVEDFWKKHDDCIRQKDKLFGVDDSFRVFSRPMRSLMFVHDAETRVAKLDEGIMPDSFQSVMDAFGDDQEEDAKALYQKIYRRARNTVARNYSPYLQGVLVFAGAGDPDFLPILWEALSWLKSHKLKPGARTELGLLLQTWLSKQVLDEYEEERFRELSSHAALSQMKQLVDLVAKSGASALVNLMRAPPAENQLVCIVARWAASLSHTQCVERTFLEWDQMNDNSMGRSLKKSTAATGKRSRSELVSGRAKAHEILKDVSARVGVKHTLVDASAVANDEAEHDHDRPLTKVQDTRKSLRKRAKTDVAKAMEQVYMEVRVSEKELEKARKVTRQRQHYLQTPRSGIAPEMADVLDLLDRTVAGWTAPQKDLEDLILAGDVLVISLETQCSAACLKAGENRSGNPGLMVQCLDCQRLFHVKCMQEEGLLSKKVTFTKQSLSMLRFFCSDCKEDGAGSENASSEQEHNNNEGDNDGYDARVRRASAEDKRAVQKRAPEARRSLQRNEKQKKRKT